jgi:hypothetical protein
MAGYRRRLMIDHTRVLGVVADTLYFNGSGHPLNDW